MDLNPNQIPFSSRALLPPSPCSKIRQIEAYVIPNAPFPDSTPLTQFRVPLDKVC